MGRASLSASQHSSAISPNSPSGRLSPSPLSANRSEDGKEHMNHFMDFSKEPGSYKHFNSQSTTSLSSAFTDPLTPRYHISSTAPSSTLQSPANEIPQPTYGMNQAISSPPQLRYGNSTNSLTCGRSIAASNSSAMASSSPNSLISPRKTSKPY